MHPGNILVTFTAPDQDLHSEIDALKTIQDPQEWSSKISHLYSINAKPQLVFLDAGLVSSLSKKNLYNFLDLFVAITQFDGRRIAQLMVERSSTPETVIRKEQFVDEMSSFLNSVRSQTTSLQHIHVGQVLATVLNMVREHHVKFEGEFVNVVVAIGLIEGIGQQLDASVDVIQESVPILASVRKRGDEMANLADQVYRKAQVYSAAMTIRDLYNRWVPLSS